MTRKLILSLAVLTLVVSACGNDQPTGSLFGGKTANVAMVYGSEKKEWLEPLIAEYNAAEHKTANGSVIKIEASVMGSVESANAIVDSTIKPVVWSPASSIYIPVANAQWRKSNSSDLVTGKPNDLVLSPVVIAMWKPMAEALGWPAKAIGWSDIADFAKSGKGWEAFGKPAFGPFRFGHTHPEFSNSGVVSVLAMAYAGSAKQRGLTTGDISEPKLRDFMGAVESSVIHYGSSTGFFGDRMFERGTSYLSAAVLYENLVVAQESKRLAGQSTQPPVVAIYPKEGTFWTNNPYLVLNAPWVTDLQKEAAKDFEKFLLDKPQQQRAIQFGFRPADPSIALTAPLDANHGVDAAQPQTVLEIPSADVTAAAIGLWRQVKKPTDVVAVLDISGSMRGERISTAKASLQQFIDLLDSRDRVQVLTFSSQINEVAALAELGDQREALKNDIAMISEGGNTKLYAATAKGYADIKAHGDPKHIRAVVVLTDGADTSGDDISTVVNALATDSESEGGNSIKVFTIGFGSEAKDDVLDQIALPTGGKRYNGTPDNIRKIYSEIATFF